MKKTILLASSVTLALFVLLLSGCSKQEVDNAVSSTKDKMVSKVDEVKQSISDEVQASIKRSADEKMKSIGKSIESILDPKLGALRKNMDDIKNTALVYYSINKKMPAEEKVQVFFEKTFADMELKYTVGADEKSAVISYTGSKYTKEKLPDITITPDMK